MAMIGHIGHCLFTALARLGGGLEGFDTM